MKSRAQRLLKLLELLRLRRTPVQGKALAQELHISLRTLYRDIATLQSQGADIRGESGVGYILKPGFTLPPMMFSQQEISALVLGVRWVSQRTDPDLASAARQALAKIWSVLPDDLRIECEITPLLVGPGAAKDGQNFNQQIFQILRQAIYQEEKLAIRYEDANADHSDRTIWPIAIGYFEQVSVLIAWCELRQDLRHFRVDRILELIALGERYPQRHHILLSKWKKSQNIAADQ